MIFSSKLNVRRKGKGFAILKFCQNVLCYIYIYIVHATPSKMCFIDLLSYELRYHGYVGTVDLTDVCNEGDCVHVLYHHR